MDYKDFKTLRRGDIIRHKSGGPSFVIDAIYGERATAVSTVDITNPDEWELVVKNAPIFRVRKTDVD